MMMEDRLKNWDEKNNEEEETGEQCPERTLIQNTPILKT